MKKEKEVQLITFSLMNLKLFSRSSLDRRMYLNTYSLLEREKDALIQFLVLNMEVMLMWNLKKYQI